MLGASTSKWFPSRQTPQRLPLRPNRFFSAVESRITMRPSSCCTEPWHWILPLGRRCQRLGIENSSGPMGVPATIEVSGDYPSAPAYANGRVYVANNNPVRLEVRAESDGKLIWSWVPQQAGDVAFISEVLLTKNLAFVSTNLATYAIDLTTHLAVWSVPLVGKLLLSSNGVLYIQAANEISAFNVK